MSGLCTTVTTAANVLGFNVGGCCIPSGVCPSFPMRHVVICFEVNSVTQVQIQVGGCAAGTCTPVWTSSITENAWGKHTRVVRFDQEVQTGAFIRITTCSASGCGVNVNCGKGVYNTTTESYPDACKLLRYVIDGEDLTGYLTQVLAITSTPAHTDGCVYVGCVAATGCCTENAAFTDLHSIPWGSEITVGPIGARVWVVGA